MLRRAADEEAGRDADRNSGTDSGRDTEPEDGGQSVGAGGARRSAAGADDTRNTGAPEGGAAGPGPSEGAGFRGESRAGAGGTPARPSLSDELFGPRTGEGTADTEPLPAARSAGPTASVGSAAAAGSSPGGSGSGSASGSGASASGSGSASGPESESETTAERARSLLVPVAEPEPRAPAEPSVAPVLPGRPSARRPQVRTPGPEQGVEGGVPCPWCSTPNRPDRRYCGRCAMPMAGSGTQAPGRAPWWRRLLDRDNREAPWAGDRPRLRRGFGQIMNWLTGALVLGLLVTAVVYADDGFSAVRDHFAKRAPVGPDGFKASRSFPEHGPELVFDKLNNTWWGPGVSQSGQGEWVEATFQQPVRLLDLVITPGTSTRADQLSKSALPHRLTARITTADGKSTTRALTLDQGAGGQHRKFRAEDVVAVRFTVDSAYGAAADKQLSIAEIELFGPSSANSE
nr:zinc ribbon domain-containing protein [Streptomyces sp. GC420]